VLDAWAAVFSAEAMGSSTYDFRLIGPSPDFRELAS
jgi:hypothetical protein